MRKLTKRGSVLLSEEMIAFILAVAGIIVIIYLFFDIFTFGYDSRVETTDSYSKSLKRAIKEADDSGIADFSPLAQAKEGEFYFLVYYGNRNSYPGFEYDNSVRASSSMSFGGSYGSIITRHYKTDFFLKRITSNTVCICSTLLGNEYLQSENKTRDVGIHTVSDIHDYYYNTASECSRCIDLKWPAEFDVPGPLVFNLNDYYFTIHKEKDSESKNKYLIEVVSNDQS